MADRLSDDEVKEIIGKVMPGFKVVEADYQEDAAGADEAEREAEAVSPDVEELKAGVRAGGEAEEANPAVKALEQLVGSFSAGAREREAAAADAGQEAKGDRIVSVEPEGPQNLADRKSRVKTVVISGETGDVEVRQG